MNHRIQSQLKFAGVATLVILLLATVPIFAQSQPEKQLVIGEQPVYMVARAKGPVTVDGKMDEPTWKDGEVQSFNYFYRADKPVDKQKSTFRMLWDDQNLYLFYECQDSSLTARETNFDGRPYLDDCAEFFCLPVPDSLNMHFGFEVNITKAAYDYVVLWEFYNERNIFIKGYNPQYQVAVTYDGTINNDKDVDKKWCMEFAIPLDAFWGFTMVNKAKIGVRWAFQAVRQDRNLVDDRFRSTSTLYPIYDIRKDVHQPNRFGLMEFTGK